MPPPVGTITQSVVLIGDAGAPSVDGDPVLQHLRRWLEAANHDTTVVFLGDNIYPDGLPPRDARGFDEAERRLMAQVDAARPARRTLLIAGNHDWNQQARPTDWDAVVRQDARLREAGLSLSPKGGCPGPETVDVGAALRIVTLDTEWWVHDRPRPAASRNCATTSDVEVLDALDATVRDAGSRYVIVAGHHPPISAGPHNGYFDWQDHLFPLREVKPWLWLPLPGIGSLYPLARRAGVTPQDLSHPDYRRMVAALAERLRPHAPLLFAAGHEHQLGLFDGAAVGARWVAVSGAGMSDHERDAIGRPDGTRYVTRTPGFMVVEVFADQRVRLRVVGVDGDRPPLDLHVEWLQ